MRLLISFLIANLQLAQRCSSRLLALLYEVWSSLFVQLVIFLWKWTNELARKLSNIFRFIDDSNTMNDGGEFESKYCNIYTEELELGKENKNKYEASLLGLGINIRDGKFHVVSLIKEIHFLFLISEYQIN